MFQLLASPFGKFKQYTIQDFRGENALTIVPDFGATLLNLNLGGEQVLDGFQTPEDLENLKWAKSGFLFPFPNRLRDGRYEWQNTRYQFPINNLPTGNAIHGFGLRAAYAVENVLLHEKEAAITLAYHYDGHLPHYPFPFRLNLEMSINKTQEFKLKMSATNTGDDPIPFGMGWHPYFKLQGSPENWTLKTPALKKVEIDERMLPTGEKTGFDYFIKGQKIGETKFDTGFLINQPTDQAEFFIKNETHELCFWQNAGRFNFVQIFIPPMRESVAIEPMTCNIDAFNNKDGLKILAPNESIEATCGLVLIQKT